MTDSPTLALLLESKAEAGSGRGDDQPTPPTRSIAPEGPC